jgi:GTP-binding protein EngB required for normal cell division
MICYTKTDKIKNLSLQSACQGVVDKYLFCDKVVNLTSTRLNAGIGELRANIAFHVL